MCRKVKNDEISSDMLKASFQGWINHARYGNTMGLRKSIFEKIKLKNKSELLCYYSK